MIMDMEDKTADEIFSVLEPVEPRLSEDEKRRLWFRISGDCAKNAERKGRRRVFFRIAVATMSLAAASAACVLLYRGASHQGDGGAVMETIADYGPESGGNVRLAFPGGTVEAGRDAEIAYDGRCFTVTCDGKSETYEINGRADVHRLIVPYGKTASLRLSDGTMLRVNSGSRVIYKAEMRGKKREIYLNGEALLDVARDETRPFCVKTDRLDVSVLGTRFDVRSYPDEESRSVVLLSGKVSVTGDLVDGDYVMSPRQMFRYDGSNCDVTLETVNPNDYVCWTEGFLNFSKANIRDVLMELTRRYNVRFFFDSAVRDVALTGKLDITSGVEPALESICLVSGLKCRKTDGGYAITAK